MINNASPRPRDYLSYSAVRTFQSCPLKYCFRYVDGLEEDCVSASLVFGSAVHSAVEHYFTQLLAGEELPDLERLRNIYQQSWQERSAEQVQFGKKESADSLDKLAVSMLEKFLASDWTRPQGRIIGVEEELRGELIPGVPDLLGRVDLLLETEDAVIVQDFKTARSAWTAQQAEDQSEQLLLYADLVRRLIPGKQLKLEFAIITKARQPQLQRLEAKFEESKLDRTKHVFERVWAAIQSGHFYPSPSPLHCPGCGYRRQCRAWRG